MTTPAQLRAAIASALAEIDGAAPYAVNIGGRVLYGLDPSPHAQGPAVYYRLGDREATRSAAAFGAWDIEQTVQIEGHIGGGAGDLGTSEDTATALGLDICRALEADVTLGGLVEDLTSVALSAAGAPAQASDGTWVVTVTATYTWRTGALA